MSVPVFPTYVPAFNEHLVDTIFGCKVNVFLHILGCCAVSAVWFSLAVIGFSELNRWEFVCVIPAILAHNHLPPYANILGWVNPTCIFNLARFVQVEYQVARKHVASIVADDYCAPRSFARSLHIALHTCGIGCQPAFKHHVFVVQIQVHCGVIDTRSFVKIDVKTIV